MLNHDVKSSSEFRVVNWIIYLSQILVDGTWNEFQPGVRTRSDTIELGRSRVFELSRKKKKTIFTIFFLRNM